MAKKTEKKPLKRGQSSFVLIGEAKINDFTFKIDENSKKSDWVFNQLNIGVDCGESNVVYTELMGGYGSERDNVLYVHGVKENDKGKTVDDFENQFKIAWEDRFDEEVLATIGDKSFLTVGLEKDKKGKVFGKKFLSAYDAIKYVNENLVNGAVINVKGEFKYSLYNENVQCKKEIKSIYLSSVEDKTKYKAVFTQTVLIDKDSVGKLDKEKAVYPITCRVVDYTKMFNAKEVKQNIAFYKVFELEVDKAKPENTKKFLDKLLRVKKDITEISLEGDILEGQSLVNVTEADLPDDIRDLVNCGAYTMEDAISKCAVGGSKEKRMIIRRPTIKMVGDDENKMPVIVRTESQYVEEDLIFDFMFEDEEHAAETKVDSKVKKNKALIEDAEEEDTEDTSWMDALDD